MKSKYGRVLTRGEAIGEKPAVEEAGLESGVVGASAAAAAAEADNLAAWFFCSACISHHHLFS